MVQERRTRPATAADLYRLANLAQERGLEIVIDAMGRHYATSASSPIVHTVTAYSCDCRGFISHGRCTHHSLLLKVLNWIPADEPKLTNAAQTPVDCAACCACGVRSYRTFEEPCPDCGGSGIRPDHRPHDAPMVRPIAA
jgi:hypothetical protein